jgi:hypothetical protein
MFRKTNPQRDLFGIETKIPQKLKSRLKGSWAEVFRLEVLPILMRPEEDFADLYGITGRPNFSVGRMLGLCLLQELYNYADQEALDAFGFDIRWQYALDVTGDEAYLSRRSLVEFHSRLVEVDPAMTRMRVVFERVSQAAIEKLGIRVSKQRIDSTHIQSNIHARGRLALFQDVMRRFLRSLDEDEYKRAPTHIRKRHEEEPNGWFGLGAAERKAKVTELAVDLHRLIVIFADNDRVKSGEEYRLLVRLFNEQCDVIETSPSGTDDNGTPSAGSDGDVNDADAGKTTVEVKKKPEGETLQSAFDTDASYGHKGQGYSTHITETCNNSEAPEIITDYEVHGAVRSDVGKAQDALQRLADADMLPQKLYADGGYPSVPSTYQIQESGVDLVAPVNRGPMDDSFMGRDRFEFDDDGNVIRCPEGHPAIGHKILSNNSTTHALHAIFDGDICRLCDKLETCPVRAPNHRDKGVGPRDTIGNFRLEITPELRLRDDMFAMQKTPEWKEKYKIRSGIEATMSEMKRSHGLGRLRVRGLARVHFAVVCKVIACNIKRWAKASLASSAAPQLFGTLFYELWELLKVILGGSAPLDEFPPIESELSALAA